MGIRTRSVMRRWKKRFATSCSKGVAAFSNDDQPITPQPGELLRKPPGAVHAGDHPAGEPERQVVAIQIAREIVAGGARLLEVLQAASGIREPFTQRPAGGVPASAEPVRNSASGQCLTVPEVDNPAGVIIQQQEPGSGGPGHLLGPGAHRPGWHEPRPPAEIDFVYIGHWCITANNFTDSNGTRPVIAPRNSRNTARVWNLG